MEKKVMDNLNCNIPPEGWFCTRGKGHDGPCAAQPIDHDESARMARRYSELVAVARAAKALSDWDGHRPDGMDSDDYHVELFKRQDALEAALSALDPDVIGGGE